MLLPDHEIVAAVESGRVGVDPWDPTLVQPASLDLLLGDTFLSEPTPNSIFPGYIDPSQPLDVEHVETVVSPGKVYALEPGAFVLASTHEAVTLPPDVSAQVAGKSSLARHGLIVETAGFVDGGFSGTITLEVFNLARRPILLHPGMKIAQLCFLRMTSPAVKPYGSGANGSRYQGQRGPTPSRSHIGFRSGLPATVGRHR